LLELLASLGERSGSGAINFPKQRAARRRAFAEVREDFLNHERALDAGNRPSRLTAPVAVLDVDAEEAPRGVGFD
jgi:hypothetical protein